jgi:hypothetical protein
MPQPLYRRERPPGTHWIGGCFLTDLISTGLSKIMCFCSFPFPFPTTDSSSIILTLWNRVLIPKLIVAHLVKKFPAFYGTHRFLTMLTKSPPLVPNFSKMNPVHSFPHYFPEILSNIIFPSTPRSSEWSLPFKFPIQNSVCIFHLSYVCYMPSYLILLDMIILIIFSELYKLGSSLLCSLLQPPTISSFLGPHFLRIH